MAYLDSIRSNSMDTSVQKSNALKRAEPTPTPCSRLASAAGSAGLPETAVGTVCTFSTESLNRLSSAVAAGYQAVEDAATESAEWVSDTLGSAADAAVALYGDIADLAQDGVAVVEDAVTTVSDGVSDAASTVAGYGALALAASGLLSDGG